MCRMTNRAFNWTMAFAISLAIWGMIFGVARIVSMAETPAIVVADHDDLSELT